MFALHASTRRAKRLSTRKETNRGWSRWYVQNADQRWTHAIAELEHRNMLNNMPTRVNYSRRADAKKAPVHSVDSLQIQNGEIPIAVDRTGTL